MFKSNHFLARPGPNSVNNRLYLSLNLSKRMKTIDDFSFKNKTALIRVDFNVPLNEAGEVTDGTRIAAAHSSIIKVLEDGGRCVLMSHLGRPKDKEPEFSLGQVVEKASDILGVNVKFANDCFNSGST